MDIPVTVIIPTLNAAPYIRPLLQTLREQTVPCEIIIMDSSSSDNTAVIAGSFGARTVTVQRKDFDHGGTRSLSADYARGEILVFMTQDAVPADKQSLEKLILPFADEKVGATYGRQLPLKDATPFAAHTRLFKYGDSSFVKSLEDKERYGINTPFLSNSFAAYRKRALQEIGLFKKGIIFAEDAHAAAKLLLAGYKIAYEADAKVYHSHNHSMMEEFRRYFDTGVFYKTEDWIIKTFGKTGPEGRRFLKSELSYLLRHRHYALLAQFFIRNLLRFAGFVMGFRYLSLPKGICRKFSMNKVWWDIYADASANK